MNPLRRIAVDTIGRRSFLAGGLAIGLAACGGDDDPDPAVPVLEPTATLAPIPTQEPISSPVAGYGDPARWAGRTLQVASWGGNIETAQKTAFFDPFSASTGADLQVNTADLERLREQIESESVAWDVLTLPAEDALFFAREGLLEPIDFNVVDRTQIIPEVVQQHGDGAAFFSTVIVYPASRATPPASWADFWTFPARESEDEPIAPEDLRALRRSPIGTLEFALLADGVAIDKIYPIDLERAFASLDRIRDHVISWYEDGKQPVELIMAEQIGMASAWNVRAWQLGVTTEIGTQWNGGMLSADIWVVPRGAPNADIAMDFINFCTRPIPSANFARLVPFGPVNIEAAALLDPARLEEMPTAPENFDSQFIQNWVWWADNGEAITERFEDWLLTEEPASPEAES
ncbi:MAG: extracellular solute-binding protein [Chloroflexota bacterium]|nr:extracellular solute-binding protein [Chloroflexota bacterium]